jgi:diaminohydroxyphosphoribosylaminopyrimidine deaminase/5-amino-6-(5-phosphoribosylamino)uracil reductase
VKHTDEYWMDRCFSLALKGTGLVSPNPLVGAVIVRNGRKLGEGFHAAFGGPHAEVNAIRNALSNGHSLSGATMYVNLEPCSHHGKTPPCAEAILKYGFSRVVTATLDPNPKVAGRGIRLLRKHHVQCTVGIRSAEALRLNEVFFKYIRTKQPFVAVKAAQTSDGFIARKDGSSRWISNARSRKFVHMLRARYDAVLVGANTVRMDDPELTVRMVSGRSPVRIVLDGKLSVPVGRKIFSPEPPTILYTTTASAERSPEKIAAITATGTTVIPLNGTGGRISIRSLLTDLGKRNIASVLVEGGQRVYASVFNAKAVDTVWLFTASKKFGAGIKTFQEISVSYRRKQKSKRRFSSDTLVEYGIIFPESQ